MATENRNLDTHLLRRLPDVFAYLLQPSLWAVLVGLALITMLLEFVALGIFGIFIVLLIAGLEIGVFFQITRSSAQGEKALTAPDFLNLFDSIAMPILLVIVAALPMLIAGYWATTSFLGAMSPSHDWLTGPLVLFVVGALLFPLLLTIAAIDRSIERVLDPRVWLESLRALGTNYLVAAAGFYALWTVEVYVVHNIATHIYDLPVFGSELPALLVFYIPRVLRYRLLGALCEPFLGEPLEHVVVIPQEELPEPEIDDSQERLQELESGTMNSRAILRMANTAFSKKRPRLVYRAVEYLWKHHPESPEVVQALWVASQAQEMEGQLTAMKATLEKLVAVHPSHPMAGEARMKLRKL